jgi:hypothetical protein
LDPMVMLGLEQAREKRGFKAESCLNLCSHARLYIGTD